MFKLPVHSKNPLLILFNTLIIIIYILINDIKIVHARSRAPAWSCYLACKITRRFFVTTFHGTYNFESSLKKFYNSVMLKSQLIVAGSNFIFNHINDNYKKFLNPNNKLLVIFRGINLEYYNTKSVSERKKEKLKEDWKLKDDSFKILLPARLTSWKGHEKFIEALNILIEDYNQSNFQAIILGSDQGRNVYTKKLHSMVERYNLTKKIKFIYNCKEMPTAYSIVDVVISSSTRPESFGRVPVEAQAMEKPIIASNLGGSKETVLNGKSGFLYKHDDPRELAKCLNTVMELDKDTLNTIGNEGRKNVIKKFDVEKMCQSTFNEYKKLLKI